jgi:allantoinase
MDSGDQHSLYAYLPIAQRRKVEWPDGARVALWVVPNIEHHVLARQGAAYDVPWFSRTDYANRVGIWRIMEVLDRFSIRGTVALNSAVCRHYPEVIHACLQREWELMGHGVTNSEGLTEKPPDAQREIVEFALNEIRQATGRVVKGWLSPGLSEAEGSLDILLRANVEYVCDWVNDDLPYQFHNGLWSIPYTNDLNDMRLIRPPVVSADEWGQLARRAFDTLYREGATLPRVMCIALHPFVIGMPSRISILEEVLEHICSHDHVWKATGHEIVDHYARGFASDGVEKSRT